MAAKVNNNSITKCIVLHTNNSGINQSRPNIGVKSKDDNNMYKKKKNKYLYFVWNGNCAKPTYITPYR